MKTVTAEALMWEQQIKHLHCLRPFLACNISSKLDTKSFPFSTRTQKLGFLISDDSSGSSVDRISKRTL